MKPAWLQSLSPAWRARALRWGFNWHPAFRGTGGRVVHVAPDLRHIRIALRPSWRTRNVVGSLYGGALFAITDGAHPVLLMMALGSGYIVWDKAASIRYKKPGYTTLFADFVLGATELAHIQHRLRQTPELEHTFEVELKDQSGVVHAVVERTVYVAEKAFYRRKTGQGEPQ